MHSFITRALQARGGLGRGRFQVSSTLKILYSTRRKSQSKILSHLFLSHSSSNFSASVIIILCNSQFAMYSLVEFADENGGIAAVPSSWITTCKTTCLWPPVPAAAAKFIKSKRPPFQNWKPVPIEILLLEDIGYSKNLITVYAGLNYLS